MHLHTRTRTRGVTHNHVHILQVLILSRLAVKEIGVTDLHVARGSALVNSFLEDAKPLLILLEAEDLAE